MRKKTDLPQFVSSGSLVLLCLLLMMIAFGCEKKAEGVSSKGKTEGLAFNLNEVSVFELEEQLRREFVRGQRGECSEQTGEVVKVYPAFKSAKPLYGSVPFAREYGDKNSGVQYHFALDESAGTGKGYDRLYFDLDRDVDLTNEKPLLPWKDPPAGASLSYSSIKQQVCFNCLSIDLDFGSTGKRPLEIMPRLLVSDSGYTSMTFVTTKAHKGQIELADQRYDVILGHDSSIGGWFDQPSTGLHLIPEGSRRMPGWWGSDQLNAIHKIGGTYYCFSATPAGDKLIVRPYDRDLGRFEVGRGLRDIQKLEARGSLRSKDAGIAVGGEMEHGWPKYAQRCQVPVGDYLPRFLRVKMGRLSILISHNYHSDGKPRDRGDRPYVYGIKIRKDEPFIFDFSNKPEVMFASPAKGQRVKLGEELTVKAILTDPKLDIMIRDLEDTTRKHREIGPDGKPRPYETNVSLDPNVVITRADGEKVAEGVMPFG